MAVKVCMIGINFMSGIISNQLEAFTVIFIAFLDSISISLFCGSVLSKALVKKDGIMTQVAFHLFHFLLNDMCPAGILRCNRKVGTHSWQGKAGSSVERHFQWWSVENNKDKRG